MYNYIIPILFLFRENSKSFLRITASCAIDSIDIQDSLLCAHPWVLFAHTVQLVTKDCLRDIKSINKVMTKALKSSHMLANLFMLLIFWNGGKYYKQLVSS